MTQMRPGPIPLDRRQFTLGCSALALSLSLRAAQPESAVHTVRFPDGRTVPAVGQGGWHLGVGRHPETAEEEAMRTGISLGMTLIDTSGNYGHGRSEEFISRILADQRDHVFLVSKVEGDEIAGDGIARACEASLKRLRTDHLDLYLLHWPVPTGEFAGVVKAFEQLRSAGKIRAWGVSNFDRQQMEDLFAVPDGRRCATNQVPYSLNNRHIERDLLPWCTEHHVPVMAYSPLGGDNKLVVNDPTLAKIGAAHHCSAAAVALAWVIRDGHVIAIPEAGSTAHVREDAQALSLTLTPDEIKTLTAAFS